MVGVRGRQLHFLSILSDVAFEETRKRTPINNLTANENSREAQMSFRRYWAIPELIANEPRSHTYFRPESEAFLSRIIADVVDDAHMILLLYS